MAQRAGKHQSISNGTFFFYLLFILSYKPIYLFLLNPINFFCLLYNGNVEEFEEKKCELLDTYEMPSVARIRMLKIKGPLKWPKLLLIVQCRSKYLHRSFSCL